MTCGRGASHPCGHHAGSEVEVDLESGIHTPPPEGIDTPPPTHRGPVPPPFHCDTPPLPRPPPRRDPPPGTERMRRSFEEIFRSFQKTEEHLKRSSHSASNLRDFISFDSFIRATRPRPADQAGVTVEFLSDSDESDCGSAYAQPAEACGAVATVYRADTLPHWLRENVPLALEAVPDKPMEGWPHTSPEAAAALAVVYRSDDENAKQGTADRTDALATASTSAHHATETAETGPVGGTVPCCGSVECADASGDVALSADRAAPSSEATPCMSEAAVEGVASAVSGGHASEHNWAAASDDRGYDADCEPEMNVDSLCSDAIVSVVPAFEEADLVRVEDEGRRAEDTEVASISLAHHSPARTSLRSTSTHHTPCPLLPALVSPSSSASATTPHESRSGRSASRCARRNLTDSFPPALTADEATRDFWGLAPCEAHRHGLGSQPHHLQPHPTDDVATNTHPATAASSDLASTPSPAHSDTAPFRTLSGVPQTPPRAHPQPPTASVPSPPLPAGSPTLKPQCSTSSSWTPVATMYSTPPVPLVTPALPTPQPYHSSPVSNRTAPQPPLPSTVATTYSTPPVPLATPALPTPQPYHSSPVSTRTTPQPPLPSTVAIAFPEDTGVPDAPPSDCLMSPCIANACSSPPAHSPPPRSCSNTSSRSSHHTASTIELHVPAWLFGDPSPVVSPLTTVEVSPPSSTDTKPPQDSNVHTADAAATSVPVQASPLKPRSAAPNSPAPCPRMDSAPPPLATTESSYAGIPTPQQTSSPVHTNFAGISSPDTAITARLMHALHAPNTHFVPPDSTFLDQATARPPCGVALGSSEHAAVRPAHGDGRHTDVGASACQGLPQQAHASPGVEPAKGPIMSGSVPQSSISSSGGGLHASKQSARASPQSVAPAANSRSTPDKARAEYDEAAAARGRPRAEAVPVPAAASAQTGRGRSSGSPWQHSSAQRGAAAVPRRRRKTVDSPRGLQQAPVLRKAHASICTSAQLPNLCGTVFDNLSKLPALAVCLQRPCDALTICDHTHPSTHLDAS